MSSTNVCMQCSESGHTVNRCPELYHPERTSGGGGGGHDHDDDDEGSDCQKSDFMPVDMLKQTQMCD